MFGATVTVYRKGSKQEVDGQWVGPDDSTFDIVASVQPLSPSEANAAADLTQGKESYYLYQPITPDAVRLRSVEDTGTSDHIVLNGKIYECVAVSDWNNGILPNYRSLMRCLVQVGGP